MTAHESHQDGGRKHQPPVILRFPEHAIKAPVRIQVISERILAFEPVDELHHEQRARTHFQPQNAMRPEAARVLPGVELVGGIEHVAVADAEAAIVTGEPGFAEFELDRSGMLSELALDVTPIEIDVVVAGHNGADIARLLKVRKSGEDIRVPGKYARQFPARLILRTPEFRRPERVSCLVHLRELEEISVDDELYLAVPAFGAVSLLSDQGTELPAIEHEIVQAIPGADVQIADDESYLSIAHSGLLRGSNIERAL